MNVILVFPPHEIPAADAHRRVAWARRHFHHASSFKLTSAQSTREHFQNLFPTEQVAVWHRPSMIGGCNVLILMRAVDNPEVSDVLNPPLTDRVYTLEWDGRLRLASGQTDVVEYPGVRSHAFNRLGPKSPDGEFYYFPYGYLFRYTGLGPINDFGFRIEQDLRKLEQRDSRHKVIAVFGGSAAWSMYCLHDEMFHVRLQNLLNESCAAANLDLRFTVLNFGMHGHVALNEILAYTLYCHRLRPDVVIAHDGFNDLAYGQTADPTLIGGYDIAYQFNLENWSQILHGTSDEPTNQPSFPMQPLNTPPNILRAYVRRQTQFRQMVEAAGGKFVWGLQPFMMSKQAQSPSEQAFLDGIDADNPFDIVYKRMRFLYDKLVENVRPKDWPCFIDFDRHFRQFGGDESLFGDFMHTLPVGDEKIAAHYHQILAAQLVTKELSNDAVRVA